MTERSASVHLIPAQQHMRSGWADSFTNALPEEIKDALDAANKLFGISEYKNILGCQINSFDFPILFGLKHKISFSVFSFFFFCISILVRLLFITFLKI